MSRQAARHHARHHKGLELVWSCHVSDLGDVRLESASNSKSCCNANVRFGTKRTCLPRRRCPLSGGMCCKTRLFVAIGFGREFLAMPCPVLPMREYGLNASVPKLDATPTLSKRRPPVAAHGKEA